MDNFNWVDYVVLGIFILSLLAGLMRGFVREVILVLTWLAAFIVASMFASPLANAFTSSPQIQSAITSASNSAGMNAAQPISMVSIAISFILIFIGVLIVGKVVSLFVTSAVEGRGISFVNRLLGGVFGLVRGLILVILMIFLVQLTPLGAQSTWTQSQFVSYFQPIVISVNNAVQPGLQSLEQTVRQKVQNVNLPSMSGVYQSIVK